MERVKMNFQKTFKQYILENTVKKLQNMIQKDLLI